MNATPRPANSIRTSSTAFRILPSADVARYLLGVSRRISATFAAAEEKNLNEVASVYNSDLSSLAKFARRIGLQQRQERHYEAIDLYKNLMEKPTNAVEQRERTVRTCGPCISTSNSDRSKRTHLRTDSEGKSCYRNSRAGPVKAAAMK